MECKQHIEAKNEMLEAESTHFKDQNAYRIYFKLIKKDCALSEDVIEEYCRELTVAALKAMARILIGESYSGFSERDIEKKVEGQPFIRQISEDHFVKMDSPQKWIVFHSGNGHSNHCASSIYFYLNCNDDHNLMKQKSRHVSTLIHELSHMYGCLHASEGIMSGYHETETTDLFYDDLSLSVLNFSHPFFTPSSFMAEISYRWISDHLLAVHCEDGIQCIILDSRGSYADIICSGEKLVEYQIEMETFNQCIVVSVRRNVFHVPLAGQSSNFNHALLL